MADAIELSLTADLAPGRLDELTRQLARDLTRAGTNVHSLAGEEVGGDRGLLVDIGKLVIDSLGGKAVAALLDVLKVYIQQREKTLRIKVCRADGTIIEIDLKNINSAEVAAFLAAAKR